MREQKTIELTTPLVGHAGKITKIVLREPSFDEFLQHGDPYVVAGTKDGTPFGVENIEVIKAYIAVCLVDPPDPALLSQASARVAREVKNAILGFFQPDVKADEGSENLQTKSPSEASASGSEK